MLWSVHSQDLAEGTRGLSSQYKVSPSQAEGEVVRQEPTRLVGILGSWTLRQHLWHQHQPNCESEQYLRTHKSTGLLLILGSTRITRSGAGMLDGLGNPCSSQAGDFGTKQFIFCRIVLVFEPLSVFPCPTGPRRERRAPNWRMGLVLGLLEHSQCSGGNPGPCRWSCWLWGVGWGGWECLAWDPGRTEQEPPQPAAPWTYPSAPPPPWPPRSAQTMHRQRDLQAGLGILLALMDLTQPHSCGLLF